MAQVARNTDGKQLYQAALLETDTDKFPERIMTARSAILDRIEESFTRPLSRRTPTLGRSSPRPAKIGSNVKACCLRSG